MLSAITIAAEEKGLLELKNNLIAVLVVKSDQKSEVDQVERDNLAVYPRNYQLLFDAYLAKISGDSLKTEALMWRLGDENVFFENGVIIAAEYFRSKGAHGKAYDILVEAARLNENSAIILKAYTLQALRMNLNSYAAESLQELSTLLTNEEFESFLKKYEQIKAENEQKEW